jgi:hypothetical protein
VDKEKIMAKATCQTCGREFRKGERRNWLSGKPHCYDCKPKTPAIAEDTVNDTSYAGPVDSEEKVVTTLQRCGEGNVCARIVYAKTGENWVTERLVEPYEFTYSMGGVIVRTWQREPCLEDPCWRCFRVDKIKSVQATTSIFQARIPVTLHTGQVKRFVMGEDPSCGNSTPSVASPQELYTKALVKALDDMELTDDEIALLRKLQKPLTVPQIRGIHGRVYSDLLADVCADGMVTDEEGEILVAMRVWLTEAGWSP